jgi:flavin reductase (DIM6/NTAB) family NADH-FMN oxidoreductase RutF
MHSDLSAPDRAALAGLRQAFGRFATGVTVVTTATPGGPLGFTANSFASVSLEPPLVLWSPARAASRFPAFSEATEFAIHVLGHQQHDLSRRFTSGGAGFVGMEPQLNPEGIPILPEALARFDCTLHARHDGGDHLIILGRVRRVVTGDGAPLIFSQGRYGTFLPE